MKIIGNSKNLFHIYWFNFSSYLKQTLMSGKMTTLFYLTNSDDHEK